MKKMSTVFKFIGIASAVAAMALPLSAQAKDIKARLGHVFAIGSTQEVASQEFASLVEERSGGKIKISVFPAGQLGGDEALGRELARGALDFAFLNVGGLTGLDPMLDFHYLPYIVTSHEKADKLFYNEEGVLQVTTRETLQKRRIEPLGFYELEFGALTNSKRPVRTPADLEGLKVRIPSVLNIKAFFDATGAQTVTLPFPELFTALQQGTVDGQDNGPGLTYNSRLFEAQKHMTLTNHRYAMGAIGSSQKLWKSLDETQREMLRATAAEVTKRQIVKNRELNQQFIQNIRDAGVEVVELNDQEFAAFRDLGQAQWDSRAAVYGKDRIAKLREEIATLDK
jgi:tripartite ATP-independent transporter DctP family solute receptor